MLLRSRFERRKACFRNLFRPKQLGRVFRLAVVFLMAAVCNPAEAATGADNRRPLVVALPLIEPLAFQNGNAEIEGLFVDLWRLWAEETSRTIVLRPLAHGQALEAVREGEADIAGLYYDRGGPWNAIWSTDALALSQPLYHAAAQFYTRTDETSVSRLSDLDDEVILMDWVTAYGFPFWDVDYKAPNVVPFVAFISSPDHMLNLLVDKKQGKACLSLDFQARLAIARLGFAERLRPLGEPQLPLDLRAAVHCSRDDLVELVDAGMAKVLEKHLDVLERRWFVEYADRPAPPAPERIHVGYRFDLPPYQYVDGNGEPAGFDIERWREWSGLTGIDVDFTSATLAGGLEMVTSGQIDVHAGVPCCAERLSLFAAGPRLGVVLWQVYSHKSLLGLTGERELPAFRVGIVHEHSTPEPPSFLSPEKAPTQLAGFAGTAELFEAAKARDIRLFALPSATGKLLLEQNDLTRYWRRQEGYSEFMRRPCVPLLRPGDIATMRAVEAGFEQALLVDRPLAPVPAPGPAPTLVPRELNDGKPLTLTWTPGFEPLAMLDARGEPSGFAADIWRLWSRKSGYPIEFEIVEDWDQSLEQVRTHETDIHTGLFPTEQRAEYLDFSEPYYYVPTSFFFPIDREPDRDPEDSGRPASLDGPMSASRFQNLVQASGARPVGCLRFSRASDFLTANHPEIAQSTYLDEIGMANAALRGETAGFVAETTTALGHLRKQGLAALFRSVRIPEANHPVVAAVTKGRRDLLQVVNRGFRDISHAEFAELEERWVPDADARVYVTRDGELALTERERVWLEDHPVLQFTVNSDFPPFETCSAADHFSGMLSEYFDIIGERLGIRIEPVPTRTWQDAAARFLGDKADVLSLTCEAPELEGVLYTRPFLSVHWAITTPENSSAVVTRLRDLRGGKVAVPGRTPLYDRLCEAHPDIEFLPFETRLQACNAVLDGTVDAAIDNQIAGDFTVRENDIPNLRKSAILPQLQDEFRFAVRGDWPELAELLDKALASIPPEEHDRIRQRWLSASLHQGLSPREVWSLLLRVIGVIALGLAVAAAWHLQTRRREQRFRGLTENSLDLTTTIDREARITYQSPSHEALLGYAAGELLDTSLLDILHADHHQHFVETLQSLTANGGRTRKGRPRAISIEHPLQQKNGTYRFFESNLVNLLHNRAVRAIVMHSRDITDRIHAEQALRATNLHLQEVINRARNLADEADRANTAKSEFLSGMSREIRAPLEGTRESVGQVLDANLDSLQRERLEAAQKSVGAVLALIDDMLEYSLLEAGKVEIQSVDFDPRGVVREVSKAFDPAARSKGLRLSSLAQPQVPRLVRGDPERLRRVLGSLLDNAVQRTREGEVSIRVEVDERTDQHVLLHFHVTGAGVGIGTDRLDEVFEMFPRGQAPATRHGEGRGLGLVISQRLIHLMGGDIGVEGAEGAKSAFHFTARLGLAGASALPLPEGRPLKGRRVLVIDGNHGTRLDLGQTLMGWGAICQQTDRALSGLQMLEAACGSNRPFDIVLVDGLLPDMSGFEFARRAAVGDCHESTHLILMASTGQRDAAQESLEAGYADCLLKPVRSGSLLACLEHVLIGVSEPA